MAHGERGDHPEAALPVPALIYGGQGEQEQNVVERIEAHDVAKAEVHEAGEFRHHSVRSCGNGVEGGSGLLRLDRVPEGVHLQRPPEICRRAPADHLEPGR